MAPHLNMTPKEVDRYIDKFRREGIQKLISVLKSGGTSFTRRRISTNNSNIKGSFTKYIKLDIS